MGMKRRAPSGAANRPKRTTAYCLLTSCTVDLYAWSGNVRIAIGSLRRPTKPPCWRERSGARSVYNWALRLRPDAYYQRQEHLGLPRTVGGVDCPQAAVSDGVAERGVQRAAATGLTSSGPGVP